MQASPAMSLCPSFNAHSSGTLADIAARVIQEFRNEPHPDTANLFDWVEPDPDPEGSLLQSREAERVLVGDFGEQEENGCDYHDDDEEFEFAFVSAEANCSPISADEIFHNGQIKPVYAVDFPLSAAGMDSAVKIGVCGSNSKPVKTTSSGRMSLKKLMTEDRDATTSCSSSEADDLESVPPGTYCVWAPNKQPDGASGLKCRKSSSTGSSKRWKLRDLLHRSNSDGKDTFVFLSPSGKKTTAEVKISGEDKITGKGNVEGAGDGTDAAVGEDVSAHRVKSKTAKEGEKRRSYLPYKQDLMSILANVNGLSHNLHPF